MKYISNINNIVDSKVVANFSKMYNMSYKIMELIISRGYDNKEKLDRYFFPSIDHFYDPFLLSGMQELVNRINLAISNQEKILIFGDYDCDGVGSTAILYKYFESRGIKVDYFLPSRYTDGYGLSKIALDDIKKLYNPDLIITVDCGISCHNEIEYAKNQLQIDVVVTDHHEIPETLPDCIIVNPKLVGQKYPFSSLCGAGVALKIVQALSDIQESLKYLPICAISTISDIVNLSDENRLIVKKGIELFSDYAPKGLKLLFKKSKVTNLSSTDISFKISPKINAAGRMGDASVALKLYITENDKELESIIKQLLQFNDMRQALCSKISEDAMEMINNYPADKGAIVLYNKSWEIGVLGIVCSRIVEKTQKPVVLLGYNPSLDIVTGSARSVGELDIASKISSMTDILEHFGGHKMAAGVSLKEEKISEFTKRFCDLCENDLEFNAVSASLQYDIELSDEDITMNLIQDMQKMEPFGANNSIPLFKIDFKNEKAVNMTGHADHITIKFNNFRMIGFNFGDKISQINQNNEKVALCEFYIENYKNKSTIKSIARDITVVKLAKYDYNYAYSMMFNQFKANKCDYDFEKLNINDIYINALNNVKFGKNLIITYDYKNYESFLKYDKMALYEQDNEISVNKKNLIVYAPLEIINVCEYDYVYYLEPCLNVGFGKKQTYVAKGKEIPLMLKKVKWDKSSLGQIYKSIETAIKTRNNYVNIYALYNYCKQTLDKKYNLIDFNFALFTFIELGLIIVNNKSGIKVISIKSNKKYELKDSKIYIGVTSN